MKQVTQRICPQCGYANGTTANFCLQCGAALTAANDFQVVPHGTDLSFPVTGLDLTTAERAQLHRLIITMSPTIPTGYQSAGPIFVESAVAPQASQLAVWEDLMTHLYALLLTRHYLGAVHLQIQPQAADSSQLCLYGEALTAAPQP